ncbi:M14 family metallopeptidase [Rhodoplanes roseus]|uniref:Succinylglutamate desuccinylase/Aspartoacylase catalytic domain-containing protein n=1 Tax=Rhodoplanes roseus TaxID=29409 RepID=A0A327KTW6_9BRAD|nr:M14 family metallopeptidase [Rhodoplanes roseus]RAI41414.1 hypothetical protein CH341_21715 [Rhodoplanes roseus]
MKNTITVGTASAPAGGRARGIISVNTLANGDTVALPVHVVNGASDGPRLWINGALHGNEFNGVIAALQFVQTIDPATLSGAVIVTPISNTLAFFARSRFSPQDDGNLGESYPGSPDGSITKQIAFHHFREIRANADYLIDLHASGVNNNSKSYSVLKYVGRPETEKRAVDLLMANGIHLNCGVDTLGENDEPVPLAGSLDLECMKLDIPAFMLELGHARRVEHAVVRSAADGFVNSLRHLGMIAGEPLKHADQVLTKARFIVRCSKAGLVVQACSPHDQVKAGEIICRVFDPFGDLVEEVRAEKDMFIISLKDDCVANPGDRVAFGAA